VKHLDAAARRRAVTCIAITVAAFVIAAIVARAETFAGLDQGTKVLVRDGRPLALAAPMRYVSLLGSGYTLLPVTVVCSVVLWRRRHRALALSLPAVGVAASLTLAVMKWIINKPRPTLRGYGFPSGHVFGVAIFAIVAVYLLWAFDAPRRTQRVVRAAAVVFVLAVGYSRLYVNAHWLSDVGGGLLAGVAFALGVVLVVDRCFVHNGHAA
jgi:undecaprenyl-diphosphatase